VRAASALAPFGDGWLVVQDDATHAAWWRAGRVTPVRVVPPVDGLDVFGAAAGTKHLKPDFEAAVAVPGEPAVLLLGSGSAAARMRASLVTLGASGPRFRVADLAPLYRDVAAALGLSAGRLNLEGACLVGDRLRWFQRANLAAGAPTCSVDVDVAPLVAAVTGEPFAGRDSLGDVRRYELGTVAGVALAVTDAIALDDGRILVSAAAEDTPNAVDDGPVVASALAVLDDDGVRDVAALPASPRGPYKVEGLAIAGVTAGGLRLFAVTDADDPGVPSELLELELHW
jgi:hypothetical protein